MAQWTVNTGSQGGQIRLTITEESVNKSANASVVRVKAEVYKKYASTWWGSAPVSTGGLGGQSGSWGMPSGSAAGWHTVYNYTVTVGHNANGTGSFSASFTLGATGTSGVPGNVTVSGTLSLTTIVNTPGVPSSVTLTRTSDTQLAASWKHNYAANAVPTKATVQQSVNGGAWANASPASVLGTTASVVVSSAANRKTKVQVCAENSNGNSGFTASGFVYTTPAPPTGCTAVKQANGDIAVSWANGCGYSEYKTQVFHGAVTDGVTVWDSSPLAAAGSGVKTWTHVAPDPSLVHVYRVWHVSDTGALASTYSTSSAVQLLCPPGAPVIHSVPQFVDRALPFPLTWTHQALDTTEQTLAEILYSMDFGATWQPLETITGSDNTVTITADTHPSIFAADAAGVRFQVSTTGQHPDPSPHSAAAATTFVDAPSCQILTPVDGDTLTEPSVSVTLAYQQAEGAELHTAHIELIDQEGYLVEAITTRDLSPVTFTTHLADGAQYTVAVHVVSAHGIASQQALSFIDVSYPSPYPAGVGVQWMEETAAAQLLLAVDLTSADGEDDGQTEKEMPTSFSLWRIIGDNRELLFDRHPWDGQDLVILDPLPALAGSTRWEIITFSDEGTASAPTTAIYDATPGRWVYFNTGPSWGDSVRIFADLTVASKPERTRALFEAAGRQRPIALFAREGSLEVSGSATIVPTLSSTVTNADGEGTEFNVVTFDGGSTVKDIEEFLLTADLVCYRDTKGRRVFGALTGSISSEKGHTGQFSYTVIEAT